MANNTQRPYIRNIRRISDNTAYNPLIRLSRETRRIFRSSPALNGKKYVDSEVGTQASESVPEAVSDP